MWNEIKENPARLSAYNDRARQMKNEAETPGENSLVLEKSVEERFAVKHPQEAPKTPGFVHTDSDGSVTKDEQDPTVKHPQKATKPPSLLMQAQAMTTLRKRLQG